MRRRRSALLAAALPAALAATLLTAPAAHAADADIVINEVQSNSATGAPDFIELLNVGTTPVDISEWLLKDSDDTRTLRVPTGTVLGPGGFAVLETDVAGGFGLGADDAARIYAPDGVTLVDQVSWTDHAFTEGRLPDGTGDVVDTEPTPGAPNVGREPVVVEPVESPVVVNEVQSDDAAGGPDWVELLNTGAAPVDVSGWILRDDDDLSALPIASGTVLAPGAFLVVETRDAVTGAGFGLGKADEIRLFTADGTGLVDGYAWTEHATTEGRLPDGSGDFVDTAPTRGAANAVRAVASPVVLNEVESNGDGRGDWIELANTDTVRTVDVSGWTVVDGDPTHEPIVLPEGTTIESGGYLGIITDGDAYDASFGLGGEETVTVRDASGAVVDAYAWTAHATTTYGRCPDMTGAFSLTAAGSFELVNACETAEEPEVETEPWPFADDVVPAVAPGTWGDDMSGLDYAADGTLFAVNNDNAEIFELEQTGATQFAIAQSWVPTYPDGTGTPDAEGLTVAGDGAIFLSTERDNAAKGVSRPSVLRVELGADGATTTTHEWNLTTAGALPELGANVGIEAIEWISDADATRLGVLDRSTGSALPFDPAAYGDHFDGVFAISVEQTGLLYVVVLQASGGVTVLQTASPGPAVEVTMALDWRAGGNALWALCDDLCSSASSELAFVDGQLTAQRDVAAPSTMPAGYTNEGLAIDWCEVDPTAVPTVAWISDSAHEGVSLRVAAGGACAVDETPGPGDGGGEVPGGPGEGSGGGDPVTPGAGSGSTDPGASGGSLPRTGAEAPMGALLAAALLLLAGLGLLVARATGGPRHRWLVESI